MQGKETKRLFQVLLYKGDVSARDLDEKDWSCGFVGALVPINE